MRSPSLIARYFQSATACALVAATLLPASVLAQGKHVPIKPRDVEEDSEDHSKEMAKQYYEKMSAILRDHASGGGNGSFAPRGGISLNYGAFAPAAIPTPTQKWVEMGPFNATFRLYEPGGHIFFGPGPSSGRVNAVAYAPKTPGTYYCAASSGGLWKSTDYGVNWTNLTDKTTAITNGSLATQSFQSVTVDPNNTNIVYAGTGDSDGGAGIGTGLLKSIDGGKTFRVYGAADFGIQVIRKILVDPANSNNLLVATGGIGSYEFGVDSVPPGAGLWRSTNGGLTFTHVIEDHHVSNVTYNADRSAVYASADGMGIYKSTDNGATFEYLDGTDPHNGPPPDPDLQPGATYQYRLVVAASPTDPDTLYYLSNAEASCYKSTDGGATFQSITGFVLGEPRNFGQGFYDFNFACSTDPTTGQDVLYAFLFTVFQSRDAGDSWQDITQSYSEGTKIHTDQHGVTVNPANPNELLISNDGGVYRLTYNPTAAPARAYRFANLNASLGKTSLNVDQSYGIAVHPNNIRFVLSGSQDEATPYGAGAPYSWDNPGEGDGGQCAINPKNPLNAYITSQTLVVYQTDDGFATEKQDITPDIGDEPVLFIAPIALDTLTPKFLYGGAKSLYLYNHDTSAWTKLGQAFSTAPVYAVSAIGVAPSDSKTVYVGTTDGHIWWGVRKDLVGTDFTWTEITTSLTGSVGTINNIIVSPSNPNRIYVCTGRNIFRCVNTTPIDPVTKLSLAAWFNVRGNLPSLGVNQLAIGQRADERILYAATTSGVYKTADSGANWTDYGVPLGLPVGLNVNDLKYVSGAGSLVAGTYGRGVWSIKAAEDVNFSLYPYLQNYRGQKSSLPVTVTISAPGSAIGETHTGYLTPAGELKITAFTSGVYDLLIKVPGFLTRRVRSVNIQPGAKITAQMINGNHGIPVYDTTVTPPVLLRIIGGDDNRLDTFDLQFIIKQMGKRVTGPYSGDVDGDGIVTKNDYDIVQGYITRNGGPVNGDN